MSSRADECRIYTDGGCHGNPGPGGWAYRIVTPDGALIASDAGYESATTNNRMELTAVISGLDAAAHRGTCASITVVTDSEYVRNGITAWIVAWERNGWRTAKKTPVKNVDLWQRLRELDQRLGPQWAWVRGHAGDANNEACDRAVQEAIRRGR